MNTRRGIALKLVSILLFSVMAACIKYGREVVPTGEAVFFRSFFAIPPILIWAIWVGRVGEMVRVNSPLLHVNRGFYGVGAMSCGFLALGLLPLPEAIAIGYAAPIVATALAALILREKVRLFRWAAVAVGMVGVLIILWPRMTVLTSGDVADQAALGAWVALIGAVIAGLAKIQIRAMTQTETTMSIVFWFAVTCTLASLTTLPLGWVVPDWRAATALVAAGLLGGTAQILMTESYRHAQASTLAPLEYTSMVWGLGIGFVIFAEIPGISVLGGAALVIAAGILIIWREHRLGIDTAKARAVKTPQG